MPVLLPVSVFLLPAAALDVVGLAGVEHVAPQNQRAMTPTGWKMRYAVRMVAHLGPHLYETRRASRITEVREGAAFSAPVPISGASRIEYDSPRLSGGDLAAGCRHNG
ncbi:hypothetical protein ACU639_36050 [Streptomyces cynarae]|uniref:hypothetical protein n=1 Tax=Streptomyces cynarae TaxID=2981134 RepID=UPI00406C23B5